MGEGLLHPCTPAPGALARPPPTPPHPASPSLALPLSRPRLPPPRRACYGVLRFVMESGAKGCEVIVSGKLRAQRAKSMKFKDGYMVGASKQ